MPTIDHITYVISVAKSETTFVSTDPATGREIRKINVNTLRLAIASLLDDEAGILLPDVYSHNTEVTLGGVLYARTIEFLSPFTFTFEEGTYGVNFEGANTNLQDKFNINGVTPRPANSAGLQTVISGSGVTESDVIDIANKVVEVGNLDFFEHTVFLDTELAPVVGEGTELEPFGFTSNAITFAESKGFRKLGVLYELIVDRQIKNFYVYGVGGVPPVETNGKDLNKSSFYQVDLRGQYLGAIVARDCNITGTDTTTNGFFNNCAFGSSFVIPNGGSASIFNSSALVLAGQLKPTFSIGGLAGTGYLELMRFVGGATILHCNKSTDDVKIVATGIIELDSTCTNGIITIIGNIKPIDNSGAGCTVQWFNINPERAKAVWKSLFRKRVHDKVANTVTIYEADNVTPEFIFDATDDLSEITPQ